MARASLALKIWLTAFSPYVLAFVAAHHPALRSRSDATPRPAPIYAGGFDPQNESDWGHQPMHEGPLPADFNETYPVDDYPYTVTPDTHILECGCVWIPGRPDWWEGHDDECADWEHRLHQEYRFNYQSLSRRRWR